MEDNHPGGIVQKGTPKDLRRVNRRLGPGASSQLVEAAEPMPTVETEDTENLSSLLRETTDQKLSRRIGRDKPATIPETVPENPLSEFDGGDHGGSLCRSHSRPLREFSYVKPSHVDQTTDVVQQAMGLVHGSVTSPPGPHQYRDQFGV